MLDIYNQDRQQVQQEQVIKQPPKQTQQQQQVVKAKNKIIVKVTTNPKTENKQKPQKINKQEDKEEEFVKLKEGDWQPEQTIEEQMRKVLDHNYAGNETLIKKVSQQLKLQYTEDDPKKSLDNLYSGLKKQIQEEGQKGVISGKIIY